jgi:hypothetical protein
LRRTENNCGLYDDRVYNDKNNMIYTLPAELKRVFFML